MRLAFVIRLGSDTRPAEGVFEGWVEEVDTCTGSRFHSREELLKFLGQRFEMATATAAKAKACDGNPVSSEKEPSRNAGRK
jgi:hypothetical protein